MRQGLKSGAIATALVTLVGCGGSGSSDDDTVAVTQATLGTRSVTQLTVDNLKFKDMNKNGQLDAYEDWRKTAAERAANLVSLMTLEEKAGLMMHGNGPNDAASAHFDLTAYKTLIEDKKVNSFVTRVSGATSVLADEYNSLQALAEASRLGIPVSLSTDPRNHFSYTYGASVAAGSFSMWPQPLGLAAIGDAALVKRFADVARQEYLAVGIRVALSPQADLATEPRWGRQDGTFGSDKTLVGQLTQAYIEGMQNGSSGLGTSSVTTVVKHFAGYGAAANQGYDAHNYYGRFVDYPGGKFGDHVAPFKNAIAAQAGGVMPSYGQPKNPLTYDGITFEQVGAGFSKTMLTDLLRTKMGFSGVILSDWSITNTCNTACMNGSTDVPYLFFLHFSDFATPWGVENLTEEDRFVKSVLAGMDQFGGVTKPEMLVSAVAAGKLTEARLNASATRILMQKFQQGLFENPYVDVATSVAMVGNAQFMAEGQAAQERSMVLLQNKTSTLPLSTSGKKVYLYNISASDAQAAGFTVVSTPEEADYAILRANTPAEHHSNYVFGSFQNEGRLNFIDGDADYEAIKAAAGKAGKTIVTVYLDRPAILTNVIDKVDAVVGNFGVSDTALFNVLSGKSKPQGKLPFELPSSMQAVEAQLPDVADDSANPLFARGHGLAY